MTLDSSQNIVAPTAQVISQAVHLWNAGDLVAFATETVYGLGADATNTHAVARIFEAKQRPAFDPLIVHTAHAHQARALALDWPEVATELADRFWPGPITFVVKRNTRIIPDIVTAGLPTVALRVPDHPVALELLKAIDRPIAAPSANRFGSVSPTTAQHVAQSLGKTIKLIVDGGPCRAGVESTILDLTSSTPVLLRPGAISVEEIEDHIGPIHRTCQQAKESAPLAPGMLSVHYATRTPLFMHDQPLPEPRPQRIGRLIFRSSANPTEAPEQNAQVLSDRGDLREAAARLFAAMRQLDDLHLDAIVADPIPDHGIGLAINDRLRRASTRQ